MAKLRQRTSRHAPAADLQIVVREATHDHGWFGSIVRPWLASSLIHAVALGLLAWCVTPVMRTLDPFNLSINPLGSEPIEEIEILDAVEWEEPELTKSLTSEPPSFVTEPEMAMAAPAATQRRPTLAAVTLDATDLAQEVMSESVSNPFDLTEMHAQSAMAGRTAEAKANLLKRSGGTAGSEKAVSDALRWLANHQLPDGGWTLKMVCGECGWLAEMPDDPSKPVPLILRPTPQARNGATALALLPMLGAGHTHVDGVLRAEVAAGLRYLLRNMEIEKIEKGPFKGLRVGRLADAGGNYYSHALATIVICEALAMSHDDSLAEPAQLLVNEIVVAQDPQGGGWRYVRNMPGDTSVTGWQFMALKSAHNAGLSFPAQSIAGAVYFLDSVQQPYINEEGAEVAFALHEYRYKHAVGLSREWGSMRPNANRSAIGVLCRMYLGIPKVEPIVAEGVKWLSDQGPHTGSDANIYYNYYATQVLRHYGGPLWEKWNEEMREFLIGSQSQQGHEKGSWIFGGSHSIGAGRLYCTSLSTMILEVYYRHLPLYQDVATEELTGTDQDAQGDS